MPTYDYRCAKCAQHIEVYQSFSEAPLTKHQGCGGKLTKVLSPAGIVLKGSGFYKNDSRDSAKSRSKARSSESSGSESSGSGSKGSESSGSESKGSESKGSESKGSGGSEKASGGSDSSSGSPKDTSTGTKPEAKTA